MIDFVGDWEAVKTWAADKVLDGDGVDPLANTISVVANTVPVTIEPVKVQLVHNTWVTQQQVWTTFAHPGTTKYVHEQLTDVPCPWALHMDKVTLHSIQVNKYCATSLARVLQYIWQEAGGTQQAIEALHYDRYSGSYNFRPIRGARVLSMHAYGLAIDFDDAENEQHATHHLFQDGSLIVQAFKKEGWVWGGDWSVSSIDAMHFQAARV